MNRCKKIIKDVYKDDKDNEEDEYTSGDCNNNGDDDDDGGGCGEDDVYGAQNVLHSMSQTVTNFFFFSKNNFKSLS